MHRHYHGRQHHCKDPGQTRGTEVKDVSNSTEKVREQPNKPTKNYVKKKGHQVGDKERPQTMSITSIYMLAE